MRGPRYDRILFGAALTLLLAVVLATAPATVHATPESTAAIEASVPMPAPANLPPPTANDINTAPESDVPIITGTATSPSTVEPAPAAVETQAPAESNSAPAETAAPATTPAGTTAPAQDANLTPAETPPPDPLASLDPADRPIAEKMRELLAKSDRIFANRKERTAVEQFYQSRNLMPLWFQKGVQNERSKAVIARMFASSADGLEPKDYKIPDMTATSPEVQAEAELRLTAALITFARHLQAGRFPFAGMAREIGLPQTPPVTADVLAKIADASDAAAALDAFSPPQAEYKALKAKLAELRAERREEPTVVRIPEGSLLRPGVEDARVVLLRQRLKVESDADSRRYDDALVAAVKAFQKSAGLNPDGVVGPSTLRHLNGAAPPRRVDVINTVIVNMERWRWYPRDLGNVHVMLNIPNYMLRVMKDGNQVWQTRVVVGKPSTATPLLTETMKFITVNPTWNVPPSIVQNEYLPALAQDPTVLARMGLKVVHNRDGSVHIYQPPGDANALGRIRFNFPNRFLVYQHDTPDKHLFKHDKRAYSHGCMRVMDPLHYAEVLLGLDDPAAGYTQARLRKMYGPSEANIQLKKPIPVHITYQTAFVDDEGKLQVRADIYGIDARVAAAVRSQRGIVEPIEDRPRVASTTQHQRARSKQPPRTAVGLGFFEALFGGGPAEPPVRPKRRIR
ncbi:MAG: L,D-transpeptidase family protein [Xanthobacteraceae bacterium]